MRRYDVAYGQGTTLLRVLVAGARFRQPKAPHSDAHLSQRRQLKDQMGARFYGLLSIPPASLPSAPLGAPHLWRRAAPFSPRPSLRSPGALIISFTSTSSEIRDIFQCLKIRVEVARL